MKRLAGALALTIFSACNSTQKASVRLGTPGAPGTPSATAGNAQATLTWTAPVSSGGAAITGYVLTPYIGSTAQSSIPAGNALSFTTTGLTNGTMYTFTVAAVNSSGTGTASAASNSVVPGTIPGAPAAPLATPGNAEVSLTWSAPNNTGGATITGYVITPYIGSAAQSAIQVGNVSTYSVAGLINGTAYTFTLAAINGWGTGPASSASNVAAPNASLPSAPGTPMATAGNAQVALSWTAPSNTGGASITSYVIIPYAGSTAQASIVTGSGNINYTVMGLTNGTAYTFTIAATNSVGTGAASAASSAVTPGTFPGVPGAPSPTAGNTQVALSWTAPSNNGGAAITSYTVTPYIGSNAQAPIATGSANTNYTVTGLSNGTTYTFTISASNAWGTGAASAESIGATPGTVPGTPGTPSPTAGNAQVAMSWTAPSNNGGASITSYTITPFIGSNAQTALVTGSSNTNYTAIGLSNGTPYTFTVAATNSWGTGTASAASSIATPGTVPGAPGTPTGTAGYAQVALSWAAPSSNGGAPITSYVITPYIGSMVQAAIVTGNSSTNDTATGLTNGTAYTFTVAASNSWGTGTASSASAPITPRGPLSWPQLTPGNGYVIPSVSLVTATFTGYSNTTLVENFGASILSSSWWSQVGTPYGLDAGQMVSSAVLNRSLLWPDGGTTATTQKLETVLNSQITAGALPAPGAPSTTVYMVYVPNGLSVNGSCAPTDAFHTQTTYAPPDGGFPIPYELVVVNDCGVGSNHITLSASRELFNAATNPNSETGWQFRVPGYQQWESLWDENGAEAGGFCVSRTASVDAGTGTYVVSRVWSNAASALGGDPCVPSLPTDVYRNVYPDAPVKTAIPGSSVHFTLTGWSNVPTAPWPLVVNESYQEWFPSNGMLSANTISPGTSVTLTMSVPSNAVPGQYTGSVVYSGPSGDPLCYPGEDPCSYSEVGVQVVAPDGGTPFDAGTLDSDMLSFMHAGNIPGMAIALVKHGQLILSRGYGYADLDAGTPMTADSLFQLESVSKTVTATALMQLHEKGYFQLDDNINNVLDWTATDTYFPTSPVTFREVLTHTASIHDGPQVDTYAIPGMDSPIPLDTFMKDYLTPDGGVYYGPFHWNVSWPPGTRYEYSNANAGLAGDLVERISGQNLQSYSQANIFTPLGMTETSWFLANLTPAQRSDIATPYSYNAPDGGLTADPLYGWPTYPDGQLRTSANQLARFLLAFAGQGTWNGVQIVQPSTALDMITEQVGGQGEGLLWESLYGGASGQYYLMGHGGLYIGYSTMMYFDPMTGAGYVCLMNSDVGGFNSGPGYNAFNNINNELITKAETAP